MNTYKEGGFFGGAASGSRTEIEGVIYEVANKDNTPPKFGAKQSLPEVMKDVKDIKKKLSSVTGSWVNQIMFDDKVYWDID
jgi:ribosome assembly protein YihI (activator of Der GTPase)